MFASQSTSGLGLAFSQGELTELVSNLSVYPHMDGILSDDDTRIKFSDLTSLLVRQFQHIPFQSFTILVCEETFSHLNTLYDSPCMQQ